MWTDLDPLLEKMALDGVVPVLPAGEAEGVAALALDGLLFHVLHLDGVIAVGRGTPAEQAITLHTNTCILLSV